jgi:hypothetical protein
MKSGGVACPWADIGGQKHQEGRRCEHGATLGSVPNWSGGWAGGVSKCSCCFSTFGYSDSGSYGMDRGKVTTWQPKDKCGTCGGKYVTHSWGPSDSERDGA